MRYFLQFPSQTEVSYTIIPEVKIVLNKQIEKLEVNDHKDKEYIEVEAFEKYFMMGSYFLIKFLGAMFTLLKITVCFWRLSK